ncbi:hypothetical protein BKA70DRAFT_471389 [Coprinopsis sp. MPI-PUGE-AT-0042]|nr:hypothetical protein BKA70DRAFT_471389 [Coprinopsis sp. MPI-PUGE-AT-0042]
MWTYNSNEQVVAPNVYSAVAANYDYDPYNQHQWAHTSAQQSYVQPQHPMVHRTMSQNSTRYERYPPQPSMPSMTNPLYQSSPATVTISSPAMSENAIPSPQWAVSTPGAVSPQLPEPSTYAQANDALDLPFRQQQLYFTKATTLPAENWKGPFIPQYIYRPHTNSDRKRYVEEVTLSNPLYFAMEGPQEFGIPLSDALHSRVKRLVGRDTPVFEGRGPSVSIRLEWPGYRPWTRQIPTKDFRSPPCPITMAKLAKAVAKCVQRFIEENKDRNLDEGTDRKWKVGARSHEIKLEDVVLVSLHHVSLGSWQPQLRLRRPRV